jgi:catechol 2,3-dioxygenase-like lactoylglutathione lyase family enzyme
MNTRYAQPFVSVAFTLALIGAYVGRASNSQQEPSKVEKPAIKSRGSSAPITSVANTKGDPQMRLGNFSVSLSVKDLGASRAFYEKLGFKVFTGDPKQNWLIMQNESSTIGLFQGMFEKNIMTYNPGWDRTGATLPDFDDVRDIQRAFKENGLVLTTSADESTTGPASLTLLDPDGNQILIDQHVPSPKK